MRILVLRTGNLEKNVVVTDERAEALLEEGYDEVRDITNDGYSFEDLYKGKPNTTPNWYFCDELSDIHCVKVFADGKPTPYGERIPEYDTRGRACWYQFFTNCSQYIVGMGVE